MRPRRVECGVVVSNRVEWDWERLGHILESNFKKIQRIVISGIHSSDQQSEVCEVQ